MNILFIDQFADLGGAQRCLLDLMPAFRQRGWNLRFAIPGDGPLTQHLLSRGMPVDLLPTCALSSMHKPVHEYLRYASWHWAATRALCRIARNFKPDLLYVNGPRPLPAAALAARRTGTPLLFHAHNRLLQSTALRAIHVHLRLAAARVIACCEYVAHSLRPHFSSIETIYNGVPDLQSAPRLSSTLGPTIGVIGRIEPEKGQLEFMRAARLVHEERPSCRFVVIGAPMLGNSDRYFRETVTESRGLPVTFTGWRNDISNLFRELDLLVAPSAAHDATPRVVMEAFSAGVPVLAFSSGGIPELITDGHSGFLVQTQSPRALANRILEVLRSKDELLGSVVRNARQRWVEDFNLDVYQQRVCKIVAESGTKMTLACA